MINTWFDVMHKGCQENLLTTNNLMEQLIYWHTKTLKFDLLNNRQAKQFR